MKVLSFWDSALLAPLYCCLLLLVIAVAGCHYTKRPHQTPLVQYIAGKHQDEGLYYVQNKEEKYEEKSR